MQWVERTAHPRGSRAVVRRSLNDGSEHRLVKTPHDAAGLQALLAELGWRIEDDTSSVFYWGSGVRGT